MGIETFDQVGARQFLDEMASSPPRGEEIAPITATHRATRNFALQAVFKGKAGQTGKHQRRWTSPATNANLANLSRHPPAARSRNPEEIPCRQVDRLAGPSRSQHGHAGSEVHGNFRHQPGVHRPMKFLTSSIPSSKPPAVKGVGPRNRNQDHREDEPSFNIQF